MDRKIYYCENCGGVMEFDVETQGLKCPNCGTVVPILNETERIVEHSLTRQALHTIRAEEKTTRTMECRGCGARLEVDPTSMAVECPYCGSEYVLAEHQEDALIPDGVLPFQIDRDRVKELFSRWLRGRWLAPGELKHLHQKGRLQGVYLPYWTFDARAEARYSAMGGRRVHVTRRGANGKMVHQVRTNWYPVSGTIRHVFDDVLVPASCKVDGDLLRRVDCFGMSQTASYAPEYFSGYSAECYTVDLEEAHEEALGEMEKTLTELASQDVLRRYDDVCDVRVSAGYRDETYKHVMLPVYTTAYTYKGKQYHVLINGQSGRVEGDYPKSPAKIAALAAAAVLALALLYWFSTGREPRQEYRGEGFVTAAQEMCAADRAAREPYGPDRKDEEERTWVSLADSLPM